jgi:hypothetical protein
MSCTPDTCRNSHTATLNLALVADLIRRPDELSLMAYSPRS